MLLGIFSLPQASNFSKDVDALFNFLFYSSLISFVLTIGAVIYFSVRYHRRKSDPERTPYIEGHPILEGSIMAGLFVLVMVIFYWGWVDYLKMRQAPSDALEISVTGRRWAWDFEYLNGRHGDSPVETVNGRPHVAVPVLVVPKGRPVKLIMTSTDVIHSFFVPDFRVKQDVVPGSYSTLWFTATQLGEHRIYCAEYCGTDHSMMMGKVKVVEPEEYDRWQKKWEWERAAGLSSAETGTPKPSVSIETPAERGKKVFETKGCTGCHTVTGAPLVGPSLKGIFGHEVELQEGKKIRVDENYIRESLMEPNAKIVKGFPALMSPYKGSLSDQEIGDLILYIKSLGE